MARVALVTGASRGIGYAILKAFALDGMEVIGTATSEEGAESISNTLAGSGKGYVLKVEEKTSIERFFKEISESHESPLVLVNNAGIARDNIALRMKESDWQEVIQTNLSSVYRITKNCLRGMTKARWGRIINVSSVVSRMGNPGQSNYAASKAGMEGYSRSLAIELAARGITVNSVAPGFIQTDLTKDLIKGKSDILLSRVPLGRFGTSEEVAALVAFLASDNAGYITGETLHINGGMYMN
ncbi:MAG: 3-oxoacyl-ACP reductase FabG [Gammaproteobacteria bacterium TMED1]|nr:MAG: 3-oxoacyl-ACP reductase FabG [Gammaproteobacteria bacterium TMED1]|tara:strand:+ start:7858 stop:8583 length:726 start_codon:yes stop_codon:yes gene_type:complete